MVHVDCQACGRQLELPDDFPEKAVFACAHCGLLMFNVEAARRFRWADVDPYVRIHGASRVNLWGGLLGAFMWVPILAVVLAVTGRFDAGFVAALALPYAAFLWGVGRWRARAPAVRWMNWVWMGMGAYGIYVWSLCAAVPRWEELLSDVAGSMSSSGTFRAFGALALFIGALGEIVYRRRLARAPRFSGPPSAA